MHADVAILGGGLTGLTLAYLLNKQGIDFRIVEARPRLGGRILTAYQEGQAPLEKGATWLGRKHLRLTELMTELKIEPFEQKLGNTAIYEPISTSPHQLVQLPPNSDPSYRIRGGSSCLIEALAAHIGPDRITLNCPVSRLALDRTGLSVISSDTTIQADTVVSTLPPNLLASSVQLPTSLPKEIVDIAKSTHTWMGESIKVGLRFPNPFWRTPTLSGTIFSNVGPIPEMYDHSSFEDTHFALKGFLNGTYYALSTRARNELVNRQLRKYFGGAIDEASEFIELVWRNERFTFAEHDNHVLPHQNNGHSLYQSPYLEGRLWIGGSETALEHPGYMEGAVVNARYLFSQLTKKRT